MKQRNQFLSNATYVNNKENGKVNLSDQICSLEFAKRLKELGVEQDSLFYRFEGNGHQYIFCKYYEQYSPHVDLDIKDGYSSFTVAELGLLLGKYFDTGMGDEQWVCRYFEENSKEIHHTIAYTEADARAKMLIHLLEKGLIKNERN